MGRQRRKAKRGNGMGREKGDGKECQEGKERDLEEKDWEGWEG